MCRTIRMIVILVSHRNRNEFSLSYLARLGFQEKSASSNILYVRDCISKANITEPHRNKTVNVAFAQVDYSDLRSLVS